MIGMLGYKYKMFFVFKLLFLLFAYTQLFAYTTSRDDYNIYKSSTHFRVVIGKNYDDNTDNQLTDKILDIAENVWQKEVVEYGFLAPENSDIKHIDIYIGNKDAYNYEDESFVSISSAYAGYALYYKDQTPYFVLNSNIDEDILKVTIAHEFFHTLQYRYMGDFNTWSDVFFYQNVWWLEATAVMMEDEVYDSVDDYISSYVPDYYQTVSDSLEKYSNRIYGEVLFAKYLKDRFGMDFIKDTFKNFDDTRFLQKIKELSELKGINFKDLTSSYAYSLIHTENFESDEPIPTLQSKTTISDLGAGGVEYFKPSNSYFVSSNIQYNMYLENNQTDILSGVNPIVITAGIENLPADLITLNQLKNIEIKKGWNLIGDSFGENIPLDKFAQADIVWKYDGKYCAYSNDKNITDVIEKNGLECSSDLLLSSAGAWVYSSKDINVSVDLQKLTNNQLEISQDYKIFTFSSSFDVNFLKNIIVFTYTDGKWSYFTDKNITLNIDKIKTIKPQTGYFIKELK